MAFRGVGLGTWVGRLVCALAASMFLSSFALAGQKSPSPSNASPAGSFDTPIKKVIRDIGLNPDYYNNSHGILSCYYFPQLLVKELDVEGNIGSEWVSVLRSRDRLPACKRAHEPGEKVIDESGGYFWGVKFGFVFLACGEVQENDCSFDVYDSNSGKQIFEGDGTFFNDQRIHMQVFSTKAGVVAKYVAAAHAGCDLYKDADCWKKVKAKFDLKSDRKPDCVGYPWAYKFFQTDVVESMIGYPVEVTLSSRPTVKTVAGPVLCWNTN